MSRLMEFFTPLARMREDLNRLFESAAEGVPGFEAVEQYPPVNVWEEGDKAFVEVELPGITGEGIDLSVTGSELTLKGKRQPPEPKDATWARQERPYGAFTRIIELPWEIDPAGVQAAMKNGILTIALAKAAQCRPTKVSVRTA